MLDGRLREVYMPLANRVAEPLARAGVSAGAVTTAGFVVGLAAAGAVAAGHSIAALVLWLVNRMLDGLDGVVARKRGPTDLGGYLDYVADTLIYAGIVVALAIAHPESRLVFAALLGIYYVNGVAQMTLGALLEKREHAGARGGRSLLLVPGFAEGFETMVAYSFMIALPSWAAWVAIAWGALVAASIVQRVVIGTRVLRETPRTAPVQPIEVGESAR